MNNLWCTNYSSVRTNTRFTVLKQEVSQLLSEKNISASFSLNMREKCFVNNVGWNITNDNNTRDSPLEETEYTGN